MRATIEIDVKDKEVLGFVIQTLGYITGVDGYKLSFDDEQGYRWSHDGQGAVVEVPGLKESSAVALAKLAETLEEWAGNVDYNNKDTKHPQRVGRAEGFREAAAEARRRKRDLL